MAAANSCTGTGCSEVTSSGDPQGLRDGSVTVRPVGQGFLFDVVTACANADPDCIIEMRTVLD